MDLDRATFLALAALLEVADTCGETQINRSLALRALLAFVALRTGKPDLSCSFWKVATERHVPLSAEGAYQNRYMRGTEARSCVTAMVRHCGWETSYITFDRLREQARGQAKKR